MKTIVIFAFLILASSFVFAQEQKVKAIPADVIDAFSMLFPSVKDVDWSLIGRNFEANFMRNERLASVLFDQDGNLMMVKNKIDHTELPAQVISKIKTEYPDWSIQKVLRVDDIKGTSTYHAELEKGSETVDLMYNQKGDFIKN